MKLHTVVTRSVILLVPVFAVSWCTATWKPTSERLCRECLAMKWCV